MSFTLESARDLLEHALATSDPDEAAFALDAAKLAIRQGRAESLAALVKAKKAEMQALQRLRGLVALAVGGGTGGETLGRLQTLLKKYPGFSPESSIRDAAAAFQFAEDHGAEISALLKKL